jgi:hypothetical protein
MKIKSILWILKKKGFVTTKNKKQKSKKAKKQKAKKAKIHKIEIFKTK